LYQDPYQYFGMLGNENAPSGSISSWYGLHAKVGREKAIQFSLANEAESEASIILK
jgi:uncharacterized protein (DUF885 family)